MILKLLISVVFVGAAVQKFTGTVAPKHARAEAQPAALAALRSPEPAP